MKRQDSAGEVHKVLFPAFIEVVTANVTLDLEDLTKVIAIGTDALVMTLPAVGASPSQARAGTLAYFRNVGADGNNIITISPNANDGIFGTIANALADSVSGGVDDKDLINTKATANKGDYCILQSDGVTGWYIVGGVGIWASEA